MIADELHRIAEPLHAKFRSPRAWVTEITEFVGEELEGVREPSGAPALGVTPCNPPLPFVGGVVNTLT
ncbi:hypothetical protein [Parafrankia sp. EUN1f]|uniref:hypothetical protein n=1 Tax=Parafrankia sp. EUN1f TaxID=102897 RepID=UPI0018DD9BCA|nr:hypothetical protein [Parafrankia sp. EUN1f]